jgi:hypothetical protein
VTLTEVPYGRWPSPISAQAAAATVAVDEVGFAGGGLGWLESRPAEDGRTALAGLTSSAGLQEVSPAGADLGSSTTATAAGPGPSAAATCGSAISATGRSGTDRQPPAPVDLGPGSAGCRYADLHARADGSGVVCVRERDINGQCRTDIVGSGSGGGPPRVLAAGGDFHAAPRLDPAGGRLAWLSWSDPLMGKIGRWLTKMPCQ